MSINQKVQSLYRENWANLQRSLKQLDARQYTNPFLIAFDEGLLNKSDLKVMIFGQETKGWGDRCGILDTPESTVAMYDTFFCQKKFYSGYWKSSFWKAFRYFEKQLQKAHPDKSIYFSWNNISKIGKSKGKTGVSKEARAAERQTFSVVFSEVQAFDPDIVIFLTGPNRDGDIKHHFKDAKFTSINSKVDKRALAKVSSEFLPMRTIRMYHPSYFAGFYRVRESALKAIVNDVAS
ncbi:hypothetical protein [Thalassolituus oleivorans]|uniref:hypothetical protein n=1 Tax=Thalassolituus oleivorans TaxID=187493 RepID=UPI0030C8B7D5